MEKTFSYSYQFDTEAVIDDLKIECPNLIKFSKKSEKSNQLPIPELNENTKEIQNNFSSIFRFFNIKTTKNLYKDLFMLKDEIKSTDNTFLNHFLEHIFLFSDSNRIGFLNKKQFKESIENTLDILCPFSLKTFGKESDSKFNLSNILLHQIETFEEDLIEEKEIKEKEISLEEFKNFFKNDIIGCLKKFVGDSEGLILEENVTQELIVLGIIDNIGKKKLKVQKNFKIFFFRNWK